MRGAADAAAVRRATCDAAAASFGLYVLALAKPELLDEALLCSSEVLSALLTLPFGGALPCSDAAYTLHLLRVLVERWPALLGRVLNSQEVLAGGAVHIIVNLLSIRGPLNRAAAGLLDAVLRADAGVARNVAAAHGDALLFFLLQTVNDERFGTDEVLQALRSLCAASPALGHLVRRHMPMLCSFVKLAAAACNEAVEAGLDDLSQMPVFQALEPFLTHANCALLVAGLLKRLDGGDLLLDKLLSAWPNTHALLAGDVGAAAHAAVADAEGWFSRYRQRATRREFDSASYRNSVRQVTALHAHLAAAAQSPLRLPRERTALMRANIMARWATLLPERTEFQVVNLLQVAAKSYTQKVLMDGTAFEPYAATCGLRLYGLPEVVVVCDVHADACACDAGIALAKKICDFAAATLLIRSMRPAEYADGFTTTLCTHALGGVFSRHYKSAEPEFVELLLKATAAAGRIKWHIRLPRDTAAVRKALAGTDIFEDDSTAVDLWDGLLKEITDREPARRRPLVCSIRASLATAGSAGAEVLRALQKCTEQQQGGASKPCRCPACDSKIAAKLMCALPGCKEEEGELKRCAACDGVAYCSKVHQVEDWKRHRKACKAAQAQRAAAAAVQR